MRIKANKLSELKGIGFMKVARYEAAPMLSLTETMSDDEVKKVLKLEAEFQRSHYVAFDDENCLYNYEGCYVFTVGRSSRRQSYMLIVNKKNEIEILSTGGNGEGGGVALGDTLKNLLTGGFIA